MGGRRNFSKGGNVDILLIFFRLLTLQCKWTFTKRFTVSTPQRKFPMKTRPPFASTLRYFTSGAVGYRSLPQRCISCHLLQRFLNWCINSLSLWTPEKWIWNWLENCQQLRLRLSHLSVLVEQNSLLKSFVRIAFHTSVIRNAFASLKLPNIHFCKDFRKISHNLRMINVQINISGEKTRK